MKRRNREWVIAKLCAKYAPELKPLWRPPRDDAAITAELRRVVHEIADRLRVEVDFWDCSHELSSMVLATFVRREPSFGTPNKDDCFAVLEVLLSRLAPFYCLHEMINLRRRSDGGFAGSWLMGIEPVDVINTEAAAALAEEIDLQLEFEGYTRLRKSVLGGHLPKGVWIQTEMSYKYNLINGVWIQRRFDALFQRMV